MLLKTDYQDDILDLTQNANRKFNEVTNQDGSKSFEDVTEYEQEGTPFGAQDVNAITKALTDETHGVSFQFGIDGNGDYGYIKDGEETVTPFRNRHTETITPNSRATVDMGLYHKKRYVDLSAVPNVNSGTYTPTSRNASLDMGATNTYRYVNTNNVPNANSGTYSVTSNGTHDMGATNNYRYVGVNVPTGIQFNLYAWCYDVKYQWWAIGHAVINVPQYSTLYFERHAGSEDWIDIWLDGNAYTTNNKDASGTVNITNVTNVAVQVNCKQSTTSYYIIRIT